MKSASSDHAVPRSKSEQELLRHYERIGISAVAGALACEDKARDRSSSRQDDLSSTEAWKREREFQS
jgi:hypothetical protein